VKEVRLLDWDIILISVSGGKDSQVMLDEIYVQASELGILDRLVAVHADLGKDVEWPGTSELVEEQCAHYNVPLHIVTRIGGIAAKTGKTYEKGEEYGDLTDYAERRGSWPDSQNRWCTSEFKRAPIQKLMTQVAREWRERTGLKRACRILDCMGFRSEESPARRKREVFSRRTKVCTGRKEVWTWLPIQKWTLDQVWTRIKATGVRYHKAYDLGMPRLSCVLCIFAPKKALILAGKHNREILDYYVLVEKATGHTFRQDVTLEEIQRAVIADEEVGKIEDGGDWNM